MTGLRMTVQEHGADLVLAGDDLELDQGLETAVLVSLFSDARLEAGDELPEGESDLRGWWADGGPGDRFGSRLWLLERAKVTQATLELARRYATEALEWLITEEIAERVEVSTLRWGQFGIAIDVEIERGAATAWPGLWEEFRSGAVFEVEDFRLHVLAP